MQSADAMGRAGAKGIVMRIAVHSVGGLIKQKENRGKKV
jgi:hypothetical protein